MNPAKALEMQGLVKDRLSTPLYQRYMQNFMESVAENRWGPVAIDEKGQPSGYGLCQREIERLNMAEAYFVKKEMMPLISWAAAGLDFVDRFAHDLWPTDFGFLYFEDGWAGVEVWGRTVITNAVSWGRTVANGVPGTLLVMYADIDEPRDGVTKEILAGPAADSMRQVGPLIIQHTAFLADGAEVGPPTVNIGEALGARGQTADDIWQSEGERLTLVEEDVPSMTRFFLSLLMMLNQTVTSVETHEVDRQAARRFRRMGLPKQVTVVQLRRHKNIDRLEGETLVEWAHRWLVRGHWRNQPYKGEDGTTVFRRIWIAPYVKGPDDKPFKQTDKVYALVR